MGYAVLNREQLALVCTVWSVIGRGGRVDVR